MLWKTLVMLIIIYFAYLLIGAAIFRAIEKPNEDEQCQTIQSIVKNISDKVENSSLPVEDVTRLTEVAMVAAENGIFISKNFTVTCSTNWDLEGSFFFCGTVLTTIGYGHIAPTTYIGRIVCIIYAIIGIPLFAIMFSGLGGKIGTRIHRLETRIRGRTKRGWVRKIILAVLVLAAFTIFFLIIPALIFVYVEEWDYHDSFYYAFITLTTVGFGDFVAGVNPLIGYVPIYRVMVYFWILFGLAFAATVISFLTELWIKAGPEARSKRKNKIASDQSADQELEDGQSNVIENGEAANGNGVEISSVTDCEF